MSKIKKVLAVLLTLAMVLGMSVTSFADPTVVTVPSADDRVTVTITGLSKTDSEGTKYDSPNVVLYQIAKGIYGTGDSHGIIGYEKIPPLKDAGYTENAPTSAEIMTIANNIEASDSVYAEYWAPAGEWLVITDGTVENGTYTAEVPAGAYIAIITGSTISRVYNPILLTASYSSSTDESSVVTNVFSGGEIDAGSKYLYGSTAVAKSSDPTASKDIEYGTTEDVIESGKPTVKVGDRVGYVVEPVVPQYPKEAVNKTFFITDTMETGLDFLYETLEVNIVGTPVDRADKADGTAIFTYNDKEIAKAVKTEKGFKLAFIYNNLIANETATEGAEYLYGPITVKYQARINDEAVVGADGNTNTMDFYYANRPSHGETYDEPTDDPALFKDVGMKEDEETVYAYQLSFKKVDDASEPNPLAGAKFGIYATRDAEGNVSDLIDIVTTNENGIGLSSKVSSGTYYVKELEAPEGYYLNDQVFEVEANWTTATATVTGTVTSRKYTDKKEDSVDGLQVGWLKKGSNTEFYALDEYKADDAAVVNGDIAPAYLASEKITSTVTVTQTENTENTGTVLLKTDVPNTKLVNLPSTGGIGTTIFTVGGCLIMIIAAGLFFASRRKSSK